MKGYIPDPSRPAQGTPFTLTQPNGPRAYRLPAAIVPQPDVLSEQEAGYTHMQTQADPGDPGASLPWHGQVEATERSHQGKDTGPR